jgi:hypothetical protein
VDRTSFHESDADSARRPSAFVLGPEAPLSCGSLQLPSLAWLHVVTPPPEILKNARALDLLLEDPQRRLDVVAIAELDFDHLPFLERNRGFVIAKPRIAHSS